MNAATSFAQFSGSATISGYHSSNVEGRDSATPDNVFNPTIDLMYNWIVANPASIKFEALTTPTFYQDVPSRSFVKSYFGVTGSFYLSNIEENSSVLPVRQIQTQQIKGNPAADEQKTTKEIPPQKIIAKPAITDLSQIASIKLAALSELMDSFDIDKKGLGAASEDIFSDLKDSVSEAVLALSDILGTQTFSESISDVVTSELANQKKIFLQVPMESDHKEEIVKDIDVIISIMKAGNPQSDILAVPESFVKAETPVPTPSTPPTTTVDQMIAEARQHLQIEGGDGSNIAKKNAPLLTLANSQTEFKDLSSQDIFLKEDILPVSKKTLATLLSIPVSLEMQNNKDTLKIYSYSTFEFKPRLDIYSGEKFGFGGTFDLTSTRFPHDTVFAGTENKIRLDSRIEIFSGAVLGLEGGYASKSYSHPLVYEIVVTPKLTRTIKTGSNFSHFFFGGAIYIFPSDRLSIGVAAHLTRSSNLRPYIDEAITARSKIGGIANDDEYSYDLTRATAFFLWRIFWDINFSLDAAYENRAYTNIQLPKRLAPLVPQSADRKDYGPQLGIDLSREFLFDSRLISIFDSFTPVLDIQSTKYISNKTGFSYKDVTTTLSFEFGF